jgi:hypothetical protein
MDNFVRGQQAQNASAYDALLFMDKVKILQD